MASRHSRKPTFTDDLKAIDAPTLVMPGDDDQIVPIAASALLSAKLLKNGTLKIHEKYPHGMYTTHAEVINPDLLAFIKASSTDSCRSNRRVRRRWRYLPRQAGKSSNDHGYLGYRVGSIEGGLENGTAFSVVAPIRRP